MTHETIEKLVSHQKIAFITSVDEDGYPNVKAMLAPRKRDGLKTFYFTTNTSSRRVAQYRANPKAAIYFYDTKGLYHGVMLRGEMEVLVDPAVKKEIWQVGDRMYYPKGVTDPDYCVLKFTAKSGRWYAGFKTEDFAP